MIRGDPGERERTVARALELGVNYFDTAPSYGQGESEIQLGRVLKHLSAEPYLGTKVGLEVSEMHAPDRAITRSLEASLRRLGRERVDLLQIHNQIGATRSPDGAVLAVEDLREGVIPVLEKLKQQGKIRLWGITGLGDVPAATRGANSPSLAIPPSIVARNRSSSAFTARAMFSPRTPTSGNASRIKSITRPATSVSVGSRLPNSHACRTPRRKIRRNTYPRPSFDGNTPSPSRKTTARAWSASTRYETPSSDSASYGRPTTPATRSSNGRNRSVS